MSLSAEVTLDWGDGSYTFALKMKQIEELQKQCAAGLGEIANRVFTGNFYFADIYQTIRLGLIGGGAAPVEAKRLVDAYVDGCPLSAPKDPSSPLLVAKAIISAVYFGFEDLPDDVGKAAAEGETMASSTSQESEPKA